MAILSNTITPTNLLTATNTQTVTNKLISTGSTWQGNTIGIEYGGTGATTAAGALTALGAYAASNPSGYITASALTPYLTTATATATYAPISTTVTLTDAQTLTNKTLGSGMLFGATINGQDNNLTRVELQDYGYVYFDSTSTNALNFTNGSHQRWAPSTGAQTLSITNWSPAGTLAELLIEGVNLGAATITWPTINWVTSTGATTTTFASNGVTLQTSGVDWVLLWTRDAGTTIYGKIIR